LKTISANEPETAAVLSDEARQIHERAIIVDGHCDTPYRLRRHRLDLIDRDYDAQVDLETLKASGITASFFVSYVPPFYAGRGAARFAFEQIELIHRQVALYPEHLIFAADSESIERAHREGKVALMIGVEGGHAIEDSLEVLEQLYERGTRYMTLTHVNTNNWADSSGDEERHGGLTDFGRQVVRRMNQLGMIVDISHVSDRCFEQVLETSAVPIIASHSSCRALTNHPRNLTDAMLRDLGAAGGVCMINFFSAFINEGVAEVLRHAERRTATRPDEGEHEEVPDDRVDWAEYVSWFRSLGCPEATLSDALDHIMHAVEVAGVEHVGIGSDFDGVPSLPDGMSDASRLPFLTAGLLDRGLTENEISGILGGNFMRLFRQVEKGRA
jgi:membrane dipeptidase